LVLLKALGPHPITGASDDDPSDISTHAQTGAQFGYTQLWMALFTFPLMTVIQAMCAWIALETGGGLAQISPKTRAVWLRLLAVRREYHQSWS